MKRNGMELETNRLILRDWVVTDIDDLIEGLNNIEISRWLVTVPNPYTRENAKSFISYCVNNSLNNKNREFYEFAIELKSEKKVIGGTAINKINSLHKTAGGGIWLNSAYHGCGYGTEAFGKRIEFAFNTLNLRRLENGYLEGNLASLMMQERLGYTVEGKRREGFFCMADGHLKDEYITALLIDDWRK
jgi:ribosomal-protein-alanine N-acetyltransferase